MYMYQDRNVASETIKKKGKVLPGFGNASNALNLFINSLYSINLNY